MKKSFTKLIDLIKSSRSVEDLTTVQLILAKIENVSWKILLKVSDKLEQIRISTTISFILSILYLFDMSDLSTANISIRTILMIVSIATMIPNLKIDLVKKSIGLESANKVASSMRLVTILVMLSSLILAPKIYSNMIVRSIEIVGLVFVIASFINKSSDMYEN